ncbi:hypothetical protein [Pseudoxanthomonas sp. UTMC 1351]|uniref:InvB/SpaK family type III secretion system chaperone n=1 Tax=Pseudoxanthomonas sp. UTMC 1351 TaxID=2695853 RepID=UPI0034CFEFCE
MNNLKAVLIEALEILGCDPRQFDFDDKSLIALHFRDIDDILIDPLEDAVWLWGSLPEMPAEALRSSAFELLTAVAEPVPYLSSDCLCLRGVESQWRVGGPLRAECVSQPAQLAAAIEGFYLRILYLRELVK